jgi:hypothetical protein
MSDIAEKTITITTVDGRKSSKQDFVSAVEAYRYIRDYMTQKQSWLYINGKTTSPETISPGTLMEATNIAIGNQVVGGN